jgi:hypothetical protein
MSCKSTRSITFVAHSLRGLACANTLASHYGSNAQGEKVVENTCRTIFLGIDRVMVAVAVTLVPEKVVSSLAVCADENE